MVFRALAGADCNAPHVLLEASFMAQGCAFGLGDRTKHSDEQRSKEVVKQSSLLAAPVSVDSDIDSHSKTTTLVASTSTSCVQPRTAPDRASVDPLCGVAFFNNMSARNAQEVKKQKLLL